MQVRLGLAQKGRLRPAVCACGRALRSSGNLRTALLYSCTPRPSDAPTMVLVAGICARLPGTPDARKCKTRCRAAQQVRRRRRSRETRRGAQDGGHSRLSVHGSVRYTLEFGLNMIFTRLRTSAAALSNRKRCSRKLWHMIVLAAAQHRRDALLHRKLRHARQEVGGRQESVHACACVTSQ